MPRFVVALAIILVGGCDRDDVERGVPASTIRVSAPYGFARPAPGPYQTGSTAAVMDLLFEPIKWHMRTKVVDGASVVFERLPTAPPIDELVATLRTEEMASKEKLDEHSLRVTMTSEAHALAIALYKFGGFERAAFVADPWETGDPVQRLRAADGRVIELVEMLLQEQWRRLLARDIDVVPINTPIQRRYYEGLSSVRLLEVPTTRAMTLVFNMERVPDLAERKRISNAIDRGAVALVCAGSADLRSNELLVEPLDVRNTRAAGLRSIGFLSTDLEASDAVRVVRMQLERAGYTIDLRPLPIEELMKSQSDIMITPFNEGHERTKTMRELGALFNYRSEALNRAVDGGDLALATEILERDVPLIPLYRSGGFAAVDAHLCGGQPQVLGDWTWLGDLHPCEDSR